LWNIPRLQINVESLDFLAVRLACSFLISPSDKSDPKTDISSSKEHQKKIAIP
jgi:hypothetical protein